MKQLPCLLVADANGSIHDVPNRVIMCSKGGAWTLPDRDELEPLPKESELFLLPGRLAVGYDPAMEQPEVMPQLAVAAFAAPGHTIAANPAYFQKENAPLLPLFAYAAVGYFKNRFWISAIKVDNDHRQQFRDISARQIEKSCHLLLKRYSGNRLVNHIINNCVRRYDCPAARNFALGRYEAPLPTSRSCNARCLGCISAQGSDSPLKTTPQCRLDFTPNAAEIVEVMHAHEMREKKVPVYSFGQGCEGDPLINYSLLAESISRFRRLALSGAGGKGTVNCNTNASQPKAVKELCEAGLTSLRVSLNSSRAALYEAYYRPQNYNFENVRQSIRIARKLGVFVSLNLLYFPGVTDTAEELASLADLCRSDGVEMIQMRNLNIDPNWLLQELRSNAPTEKFSPSLGLKNFMQALKKLCPWLRFGYFNPYLGEKAVLTSPEPASS